MKRMLLLALACCVAAPSAFAQPLPPPQNPAVKKAILPPQGPVLVPPQNAAAPQIAANNNAPKKGKPPEFFAARRQAQVDRRNAAKARMYQFQAARAAEDQKLYQDWHERYLADTPVRVEYYRAAARAYEADIALAYRTPYFWAPPVFVPVIPYYYAPVPVYSAPIYGTVFWAW